MFGGAGGVGGKSESHACMRLRVLSHRASTHALIDEASAYLWPLKFKRHMVPTATTSIPDDVRSRCSRLQIGVSFPSALADLVSPVFGVRRLR